MASVRRGSKLVAKGRPLSGHKGSAESAAQPRASASSAAARPAAAAAGKPKSKFTYHAGGKIELPTPDRKRKEFGAKSPAVPGQNKKRKWAVSAPFP